MTDVVGLLGQVLAALLAPIPLVAGISTSVAEIAGFAAGAACVWLAARASIWTWPIGNVNSAFWLVLFLGNGLYADSVLQVVYLAMGFYGWWHWLRGGEAATQRPVEHASRRELGLTGLAALVAIAAWTAVLATFTNSTVPFADAATTVLSLAANWLLARKLIENWPVWIAGVNLPYIGLYLYKGLVLTASLQVVYIVLSIVGWRTWRRILAVRGEAERAAAAGALLPAPLAETGAQAGAA
jgi:nicotinamide mononucleotide transporter